MAVETSAKSSPPPRLLDRLRSTLRARHYRRRTERAYAGWIKRLIHATGRRHPAELAPQDIMSFLTSLAVDRRVAPSTQNQALAAILFLYREVLELELPWLEDVVRAKRPHHLPTVLTRDEVRAVLARVDGTAGLLISLLYGSGLRLLESCRLRVQDIDFGRHELMIRRGKGARDRRTMLPSRIESGLVAHLERVKAQHAADLRAGAG